MTDTFASQDTGVSKKKIVIVEDDSSNAEALSLLLQLDSRYETLCFSYVKDILDSIDELISLDPALFVLDYNLPRMTGFDLYHRLHSTPGLERVPAILLSARTISENEKALIARDHLFFVSKPYNIEDLFSLIQSVIFY